MNILRPLKPIQIVRNGVFLAGPTPRVGKEYNDPCDWREEAIKLFEEKGFDGDIIDPVNRNFDKDDLRTQVEWESTGLRLASAIIFWIPRSEEHPALTTNIEFGEWLDNPTTFVGFPKEAIKNDYLKCRCDAIAKPVFNTLEELVDAVIKYFNAPAKWFATSDTHFGAERTLELSRRPFRNVGEMDLTLISNWNKTVRSKDNVIHLGDFGDRNVLRLLNFSKMVFLKGNYENKEENFEITDPRVQIIPHGTSIKYRGKTYFLTHEPLHKGNDEDKFYLYGHIHRLQIVKKNGINVGTDCYRFTPIDFDEIEFLRGGIENHFDDNVFTDEVEED